MHGSKSINPPRDLRPHEQALLQRLLSRDFPGNASLREQAKNVKVAQECGCGCPSIVFAVSANARPAEVLQRVPVEAEYRDADGMGLHFLLHVNDGFLRELEMFREDSEPIKELPWADVLVVLAFRPAGN